MNIDINGYNLFSLEKSEHKDFWLKAKVEKEDKTYYIFTNSLKGLIKSIENKNFRDINGELNKV